MTIRTLTLRTLCVAGFSVAAVLGAIACGTTQSTAQDSSAACAATAIPHADGCQGDDDEDDSPALRAAAADPVVLPPKIVKLVGQPVFVKLLGINDFHGQLSPKTVSGHPAGGAAVLTSYLKAASAGKEDRTFIVHAGDQVGASPPNSALLQDEPAISFLNGLTNSDCHYNEPQVLGQCNVIGTLGNHEFDEGTTELFRLLHGGNHPKGPFLDPSWAGAKFPYVSANVVDAITNAPLFPPYVIRQVDGVKIAFIGAVLKETPTIVTPTGVAGVKFLDEADAINSYIPELHQQGVHTIIVQIHKGASQKSYTGLTSLKAGAPSGDVLDVISRLDDDIDVIVSGHTHQFTNAVVNNKNGVPMLVVQAFSASTAYDDIDLVLDSGTGDVISRRASIVTTFGDSGPGLTPDASAAALVAAANQVVAPLVNVVVGQASVDSTRTQNAAGESALGDLIAESQRVSVGADFALMNPGGIRADLAAGTVTWGDLFTIQPFGNTVVKLTITGQLLYDVLNQQWGGPQPVGGRFLQIAGFGYTWDSSIPEGGQRVIEVHDALGNPISKSATYTLAANNFIVAGGDNFTQLLNGTNQVGGPVDLDALINYIESIPQPFSATIKNLIVVQ